MEAGGCISQGAMGSLLKKLTDLLAGECSRLKGVRRMIRSLRSELNHMNSMLQKYTMMENPDNQVKTWAKEVRELAYDIEDCINVFVERVGTDDHHGPGGIKELFRKSARCLKTLGTRHHIANQIQDLKARVIEVNEQRVRYKLDDAASSNSSNLARDPRSFALFVEEARLVGIDGPRDDLVNWLVEGEDGSVKHRKVLSIFGFGGLGKTTLANEVYRKIRKQFHYQAFVSVSQKPDMKKILGDILYQLVKIDEKNCAGYTLSDDFVRQRETWDEERLIEKLRELLQLKRYIIIIDDVWSTTPWEHLKSVLPENNHGSRVITTTRIESIAKACCSHPDDLCYKIKPLSEIHSRSLFFKRIFGCEDGCPDQLKHVSAEILKKCGGLPLAIVSIASLLASKSTMTKEQWEKVRASIGSELEENRGLEGMKTVLSLSYNDLPHYLKTCLLYLSMFPEDYEIKRVSLVRQWIAEGFINEERGQSMEDVAESYFNELINRSMILPMDIGSDGKARACRMHDMMLELIISKATEENFVTLLGVDQISSKPEGVVRRLSVQNYGQEHLLVQNQMMSLSHVRSLMIFGDHYNQRLSFDKFRVLRVLSIDCELFEEADFKLICKMYQLKYLRLVTDKIPTQIGELPNLETLELKTWVAELPRGVTRLQKLRHLVVDGWETKLPEGVGSMRALQTFSKFSICNSPMSAVQELGNLTNLRELSVSWNQAEPSDARYKEYFINSLTNLSIHNLRSLHIDSITAIPVDFLASLSPPPLLQTFWMWNSYFQRCPKWIAPLNTLTELKLDVWELEENDVHVLGGLQALLHFELWVVALRKEKIVIPGTGFQSLKAFGLYSGLPCLTFEERTMPKLETLGLMFSACGSKSYGSTHSGIEHLRSLKHVVVEIYIADAKSNKAAVNAIKNSIATHPNKPAMYITYGSGYLGEVMEEHPLTDDYPQLHSYVVPGGAAGSQKE